MWRWCSRSWASGGCAAALRRCSIAGSSRRRRCGAIWRTGPRDLTAAVACRPRRRAASRGCSPASRRPRRGSSTTARSGIRSSRCSPPTSGVCAAGRRAGRSTARAGQAAFRALIDRLRGYFLTQDGKPREQGLRRHRLHSGRLRLRRRLEAASSGGRGARAGDRGGRPRVPTRSERRPVARRLADLRRRAAPVPADARRARAARFLRRARAGGPAAEGDGRVRAQPVSGSRRATATCSSTSSRTPAARSGSSSPQLVRSWGEGLGAAADALAAVDLHRRRSQAVDLRLPRRRRRRCSTRRRRSSSGSGPTGDPRRAISVSFRAAPALLAFVNDVFGAIVEKAAGSRPTRFRYEGTRFRFPTTRSISG